jgi:hypothetical protein
MTNDTRRPCWWKIVGRRAGWSAAAALMLALPGLSSTLSFTTEASTGDYLPGYFSFDDQLVNANSSSNLSFTKQIFAPDGFHVAFMSGDASFGRLGAESFVATNGPDTIQAYIASMTMSYDDAITIHGASSGFLSFDVSLHADLSHTNGDGNIASGNFFILTESLDQSQVLTFAQECLSWVNTGQPGYCAAQLGPLAPLKSATSITPDGTGGANYQGQATIFIPFSLSSFDLHLSLSSTVFCHAVCSESSDLSHTALIGGVKILDSSMAVIPGAFLTSDSGYDYVTPPGASTSTVPEPGPLVLVAAAIGFLVLRRRVTWNKMMNRQILRFLCLTVVTVAARADDDSHGFTASLQNCTELIGLGPVSFASARALVPASYTLVPFNGAAGLVIRTARCESVRTGKSEPRPVTVAQVGIAVVPPDGTGEINNYELTYVTDDSRLADALNEAGVPAVLDRALAYEFSPDASGQGEVYSAVSPASGQAAWFLTGTADLPPPAGAPVVANWWFNTSRRMVKMATEIPSINYGAASFSLHTSRSSHLGQLIGGNTDAVFVFFNARGVFAAGGLTVSAR